eukprot:6213830-Pleurochrysis_carterae.AAC.1
MVARRMSVCAQNGSCYMTAGQVLSERKLHREDRGRESSGSRCRHALWGINSTHEQAAQRHINVKACNCACTTINLGIYNLNLTYVAVTVSVDRAPAEVWRLAYEDCTL